jgi:hypothetical protein
MADEATEGQEQAQTQQRRKHKVPDGYITPVEARHRLVEEGLAKGSLNSAQIYILSRAAKNNGMPVLHFDAEGNAHEERQVDEHGNATTRPGISWEGNDDLGSFKEWWVNRPKRQAGKPKEDGDKAASDGEAQITEAADEAAEDEAELAEAE